MEKTIIRIRYSWEYFLGPILTSVWLTILLIQISLIGNEIDFQEIVITVGCVLFFIAGIIATIVSSQTAEVSEKGILFKNLFRKLQFLSWQEIQKIQIEDTKNLSMQGIIHETKWVCIYYNQNLSNQKNYNNSKKIKCRYICPTEKNIYTLQYYIHKYAFTDDQFRNDMLDIW